MSRRLLLVDDETTLLRLWAPELGKDGWDVTTAASLAEAKAAPGPFAVIVADVRLPNGDGRHLRALYPGVPFLTISGGEGSDLDLKKPFSPSHLRAAVNLLMGVTP